MTQILLDPPNNEKTLSRMDSNEEAQKRVEK